MTEPRPPSSAERLRARLDVSGTPLRLYMTDAQYHAQIRYTCQLLDIADEVLSPADAAAVADRIYDRLAGEGAEEAAQRIAEAAAELDRLSRTAAARPLR